MQSEKPEKPEKPDKLANPDRFSRQASYQEGLPENSLVGTASSGSISLRRVHCLLCPHNCIINVGRSGVCKTRVNKNGVLYTMAYGNPCSISVDPMEKKPLFHFFPGSGIFSLSTAGCNFRCLNCQNWSISQKAPSDLQYYDMKPQEVVAEALRHKSSNKELHITSSIAFTYTEPTVFFEYMYDIAREAHKQGVKTVMISNGYINRQPLLDLVPYLDAANIDLKCFDDAIYHKLTGGSLQPVLDTLKTLKERGVWLEITNLIIPSLTDDPDMIKAMCEWLAENGFADTPLHFSRFFPTFKLTQLLPTSPECLINSKEIAERAGLKYVYIGNLPYLRGENTHCPKCGKTLVEREGYRVTEMKIETHIDKNFDADAAINDSTGLCGFCGEKIAGVWG
ncbi:MAG: AmmeMemoRadiSam system radical SAM enzyme [Bacteroidetes bacterium GWF2_40_14]|nr:MAG: AmmeMemoRadiSam system radical SAM enzyme [Bacteroidetes bacterium GWF2_40_14]